MRDRFSGELLPLAYCSACDSYYPENLRSCKWCGTKPGIAPVAPTIWKTVGAVAVVALVGATWLLRDTEAGYFDKRAGAEHPADSTPTNAPTVTAVAPPAGAAAAGATPSTDTSSTRMQVASTGTAERDPPTVQLAPTASDPSVPAVVPVAPASPPTAKTAAAKPPTAANSGSSARWVSSVAKEWIVVRARPSKQSRLVASIGPNSRVQLGETRGGWRRIRATGIAGWVETSAAFASIPMAPSARASVSR